jgi:hypothetical protein
VGNNPPRTGDDVFGETGALTDGCKLVLESTLQPNYKLA